MRTRADRNPRLAQRLTLAYQRLALTYQRLALTYQRLALTYQRLALTYQRLALTFALACLLTACASGAPEPSMGAAAVTPGPDATLADRSPLSVPLTEPSPTPPSAIRHLEGVQVSVFAGSGQRGGLDGPAGEAQFDGPFALALDSNGILYVAERNSGRIRVLDREGFVRTWIGTAGDGQNWLGDVSSPFTRPTGLTRGPDDEIYVMDAGEQVSVVHANGTFLRLAPDAPYTGAADAARALGWDVARAADGRLYLSDAVGHRIRMLTPDGVLVTVAGTGEPGYVDGEGARAQFSHPNGLALDDEGRLYVADGGSLDPYETDVNACVRLLSPSGVVSTLAGSNRTGHVDGAASEAAFRHPLLGIDMDADGNVWLADMNNHAVRAIMVDEQVYTAAGSGAFGLREGSGATCELGLPADVIADGQGGLYVADYGANVIWYVALPAGD